VCLSVCGSHNVSGNVAGVSNFGSRFVIVVGYAVPNTTDPALFVCSTVLRLLGVGEIMGRAMKHSSDRWQHWGTWDQCLVCPEDDEAAEESGH